ncbi:hypothetical protein LSTR_LSTR000245 [Laodelphax striatellus]|uniref:Uncharacterized protein n=1 Tax=Laodelphax striatellus TaxID=195883 RepID=A0A482X883_LAOST|nr:hypothetical protein LSTR_LSTR000245 [Laodelphax striatellus]
MLSPHARVSLGLSCNQWASVPRDEGGFEGVRGWLRGFWGACGRWKEVVSDDDACPSTAMPCHAAPRPQCVPRPGTDNAPIYASLTSDLAPHTLTHFLCHLLSPEHAVYLIIFNLPLLGSFISLLKYSLCK